MNEHALVPFGKYRGQPAEVFLADRRYTDWALSQPDLQQRYASFFQLVLNAGAEPAETPEHNLLQAKFLDEAARLAVVAACAPAESRRLRTIGDLQSVGHQAATGYHDRLRYSHPRTTRAQFEVHSIDVFFEFEGAGVRFDFTNPPECSCAPLEIPDEPPYPLRRHRRSEEEQVAEEEERGEYSRLIRERSRLQRIEEERAHVPKGTERGLSFADYTESSKHEASCERSGESYFRLWRGERWDGIAGIEQRVFVECKPVLGDDYPATIRQVDQARRRIERQYGDARRLWVVVASHFSSAVIDLRTARKIFAASNIHLVLEAEVDAIARSEREDWGLVEAPTAQAGRSEVW